MWEIVQIGGPHMGRTVMLTSSTCSEVPKDRILHLRLVHTVRFICLRRRFFKIFSVRFNGICSHSVFLCECICEVGNLCFVLNSVLENKMWLFCKHDIAKVHFPTFKITFMMLYVINI